MQHVDPPDSHLSEHDRGPHYTVHPFGDEGLFAADGELLIVDSISDAMDAMEEDKRDRAAFARRIGEEEAERFALTAWASVHSYQDTPDTFVGYITPDGDFISREDPRSLNVANWQRSEAERTRRETGMDTGCGEWPPAEIVNEEEGR